jgi:hypothetical protein
MFGKELLRLAAFAYRGEDYDQDDATRLLAHLSNLVGVWEMCKRYDRPMQTMWAITERDDFPLPLIVLKRTKVWSAIEADEFMKNYKPKPGRPRKHVD